MFYYTPLIYAVVYGYAEIVEILLEKEEIDVNCRDNV